MRNDRLIIGFVLLQGACGELNQGDAGGDLVAGPAARGPVQGEGGGAQRARAGHVQPGAAVDHPERGGGAGAAAPPRRPPHLLLLHPGQLGPACRPRGDRHPVHALPQEGELHTGAFTAMPLVSAINVSA